MKTTADLLMAAAPHAHDKSSVDRIMLHVCLALSPVTAWGFYLFGWPAIILWTITCLSAVASEAFCLWLRGYKINRVSDASALLTGWLLALSLPPWAPWWIGVGGSALAIIVGKHLYGGIGQNIFNPAMLARVALLVSFPVQMTTWIYVEPISHIPAPDLVTSLSIIFSDGGEYLSSTNQLTDGVTGATILGELKTAYTAHTVAEVSSTHFQWWPALTGITKGSMGETSEILILIGAAWLLLLRIISWHIPVSIIATIAMISLLFHVGDPDRYASPILHLTSGGLLFTAFFIATDYVTSPSSPFGKILFGCGTALVMFAIRSWGGFPEGAGFAVLFMNALTPLIDRYCKPRAYGRDFKGKARKLLKNARKVI
ncbi:RnfABCDGE type electron transport complex subunit D [Aurantivibrio plasticivorans]